MTRTGTGCDVRPAVDEDLLGVVRLIERAPELTPAQLSDRQRATWDRMLAAEGVTVYVAQFDRLVVGTTTLIVAPSLGYDCRPTAFVEAMVVAAAHRRRGIGRQLVEQVLDDLRAVSCRKVQLLTHKRHADDGGHDFYRSLGFEPEAEGFRLYL